jgi:cysteine-rich repeat protein
MSKRITTLFFLAALAIFASAWLSGAAQAGTGPVCGDNNIEPPETCDDGNTTGGDGCSAACIAEVCGDDVLEPVTEECDDGNTVDNDGCSATCTIECGNGTTGPNEECDDGNQTNGDGCDDDVSTDPPGNCTATACGNGVIAGGTPPETCDDGNTVDGDGCDASCQEEDNPQTKAQQKCINAVNKNLAGVLKAQSADNAKCVKDVAAEKQINVAACLGTDVKQKVQKAQDKTTATFANKCDEVPGFAFTDATTVNNAGEAEKLEAFTTLFGDPAPIVLKSADKDGAKCQAEALKQMNAVSAKWTAEANKAKKTALKGKGAVLPVASATELAAAIDTAVAANTKITSAENKANTGIANKCTDATVDALFDCGGVTTTNALALCVIATGKDAACNALELADGLSLDCPLDTP